jgi:O-antigen/teichoic acid export membrane protein
VTATNAPTIAGLFAQEKLAELQQAATWMAIAATLFTLPVVLVLALFGRSILGWFGADFSQGYAALVILLAGQTVNALCGAGAALLGMTGRHRELALAQTAAAVVKLVLLVVVIPVWGLIGAAVVSVGCTAICNALMVWFVARRLNINSAAFVPVSLFGSRSACPRTIA